MFCSLWRHRDFIIVSQIKQIHKKITVVVEVEIFSLECMTKCLIGTLWLATVMQREKRERGRVWQKLEQEDKEAEWVIGESMEGMEQLDMELSVWFYVRVSRVWGNNRFWRKATYAMWMESIEEIGKCDRRCEIRN